jgi:hypothetical protein
MGLDVARMGTDKNVLWTRHHGWVIAVDRWSGLDTYESATRAARYVMEWERLGWICESLDVDAIGVGAGVVDALYHCGDRFHDLVYAINVARRSSQPDRFRNVRSELAWGLRTKFREYEVRFLTEALFGPDLGLPTVVTDRFSDQAASLRYKSDERMGSGIIVESKEEYKSRVKGKSPDEFDAMALCFNESHVGAELRPSRWGGGSVTYR